MRDERLHVVGADQRIYPRKQNIRADTPIRPYKKRN